MASLFGLGIYLLSLLLEKVVISYTNLYIQPLPNFEIESNKWIAMAFGYLEEPKLRIRIPLIRMVFSNEEYGRKIHSLLLSWNYDQVKDVDNNICMSIILDGKDGYIFFCYPSTERETVTSFFRTCEKEGKERSLTDVQTKLLTTLILGKGFRITPLSYLRTFLRRYKDGNEYLFEVAKKTVQGNTKKIEGTDSIIKSNLKIKNKDELTRKDIEYDLLRTLNG